MQLKNISTMSITTINNTIFKHSLLARKSMSPSKYGDARKVETAKKLGNSSV